MKNAFKNSRTKCTTKLEKYTDKEFEKFKEKDCWELQGRNSVKLRD